jgi:peptide/nickel transport system permease protein
MTTSSTPSLREEMASARRQRGLLSRLLRDPAGLASLIVIAIIVVCAVLAPVFFPDASAIEAADRLRAPSGEHIFGTDELGRDMLARIMHAGQLTLVIALGAMLISLLIGVPWGLISGSSWNWLDEILMRTADAVMAIPMILFALVFVAALGSSPETLIVVLGIIKAPLVARVVRSSTIVELAADYVRGLTVVGLPRVRIIFQDVLPNVFPVIASVATLNIASAIMVEASLSFLGLGVQPPLASWGTLLKMGYGYLHQAWWYVLIPAVTITVLIAAFNTLGRKVQQLLDRRAVSE